MPPYHKKDDKKTCILLSPLTFLFNCGNSTLFYKELQDATHYDIAKLNVFYERYKHIIIPQEIEHYAEISKLHFDILEVLNKHID